MSAEQKTPADIARAFAKRARTQAASGEGAWRRETYALKRGEAQIKACPGTPTLAGALMKIAKLGH